MHHSTIRSFSFAFAGLKTAFKREPHFKFHIVAAIFALVFAFLLGFSRLEWLLLVFTISLVLVLELVNTSLEAMVNIVSPEIQEEAKVAKDVAAASVLISAISAVIIGALLFIPKLLVF